MAQEAADEHGGFILPDVHHDQTITPVSQPGQIETGIPR